MNLARPELIKLMERFNIPTAGKNYVLENYDKNTPSRKPSGHYLTVVDIIASRKMMWTRDSESRSTELPFLFYCEFSRSVLLYYFQPSHVTLRYVNNKGKKVVIKKRHDALIISTDHIWLAECKKNQWLENAIIKDPTSFTRNETGFHYVPAEISAKEMGLSFRLMTDRDFTPQFTRNCTYLFNFIDELSLQNVTTSETIAKTIQKIGKRARLSDLTSTFGQLDTIRAIFNRHIFVDFDSDLLCEPELTWVYSDKAHFEASKRIAKEYQLAPIMHASQLIDLKSVWWDGVQLEVVNCSHCLPITLHLKRPNDSIVTLHQPDIERLIEQEDLYFGVPPTNSNTILSVLCSKKAYQIDEASKRLSQINGNPVDRTSSERTLFRYKSAIKNAEDPFIALLSNKDKRGNRECRLTESTLQLMNQFFKQLQTPSSPSVHFVWNEFKTKCEDIGVPSCSYETFNERFKQHGKYKITLAQAGFKAAYALGPQPREIDLDWDLPYHGDFIFEVAHIDHTPIEMCLISSLTGEVLEGTLNLSIMYDGHSRVILAVYISYEKPSYRSTLMLLRECYRRHQRVPLFICVDGGPDFQGVYFASTIADIGCNKRNRPKSAPRHGSPLERTFGTSESELIHTLEGNKRLQKLGRGLSSTHKPEKFAVYTPDEFDLIFKNYAYNEYPNKNRRGISERPLDRWNRSLAKFDEVPGIKIKSAAHFNIITLPDIHGGPEKLKRLLKNQMVFRGCNYLLSKRVKGYDGGKIYVRAKYDPYDLSYIMACINDQWAKLSSNDVLVRECRDKGVKLPHMEAFPRRTRDGRRYRNGSKNSKRILDTAPNQEQIQFSLKQASIGPAEKPDLHEPPIIDAKLPDFSSIPVLNKTILDGDT